MANQQLVSYIRSLHNTYSEESIRSVLSQAGWTTDEVNDAYATVELQTKPFPWAALTSAVFLILITALFAGSSLSPTGHLIGPLSSAPVIESVALRPDNATLIRAVRVTEEIKRVAEPVPAKLVLPTASTPAKPYTLDDCKKQVGKDRDSCYNAFGIARSDKELCNRVSDISLRSGCIISAAIQKHQKHWCHNVRDVDACYEQYAHAVHDASACLQLVNKPRSLKCRANI